MTDNIRHTKDQMLERLEKSIKERGIERIDVQEAGMLADIVKDLSEAEKSCWEAEYYMAVTNAMGSGSMGYDPNTSRSPQMGYDGMPVEGYRGRDSMGRYTSRGGYQNSGYQSDGYQGRGGYHGDVMQGLADMMSAASPQEREQLRMRLRQMIE